MDLLPLPVTLVVKAPNQKIADQTVECALDWTVKRLKNHLSAVYPSQPQEHQQRIIYSGRLLQDDLQLKDFLHQFDPDQTVHTVHLVCSNPESYAAQYSSTTTTTQPDTMATEGVRHRRGNHNNQDSSSTQGTSLSTQSEGASAGQTQTSDARTIHNPTTIGYPTSMGVMPPQAAMVPGFPYSPEQMMWLQQMYTQQMAQYMQYYQGIPQPTHIADAADQPPANQNAPLAQPANQQGAAPERDQPMVMNAAGEAVMDDDEELGNQDWLDWMYTCSRFLVLLSIVYFYSTFSRFIIVAGTFLLMNLYHRGWFRLQREVRNRQAEPQRNEQENIQNEENARREEHASEEDQTSEEEGAGPEGEVEAEPSVGVARTAFSFVTSFFTSLVPQPPPPVNVN